MNDPTTRPPIEPLFASNERLWLRVWATTQGFALGLALLVAIGNAGGVRAFAATPHALRTTAIVVGIALYHVVGIRAHAWLLRRPAALAVFLPVGWALILASLAAGGAFGLLVLGAIIQGFIFLPFAWAIAILTAVVLLSASSIVGQASRQGASLVVARTASVLATGIMIGTVMLYIHRANRDAAIRARLIAQLDAAQRDLAERAKDAGVQEERQRLARDIHDTLAQGFASVIRHLEAVELSVASRAEARAALHDAMPHLAHAQAVSRTSLSEIRRLVWALQPPQLAESTLGAALERLVAQWGDANGVAATCTVDATPPLTADADVIILRATQEALSNVARHAHATRVAVTLQAIDGLALLTVEDDGRGIANADVAAEGSMGLDGMRARIRPFGGRVLIESERGKGTSVTVALPLAAVAAPNRNAMERT